MTFKALVLDKENGTITAEVRSLDTERLPEGDVLVSVMYSGINYKDALAITGRGKIIRGEYPFVPGIDLVGEVVASDSPLWHEGDLVIGTGWGLGENTWGGLSEMARVRGEWLVPLPDEMTPKEAMVAGTAGFTAMLSAMALRHEDVGPERGEVVVTGATGGVGSFAVCILSHNGYRVVASTGKTHAREYLEALGAKRLLPRDELGQGPRRPLDTARWAAAVDSVGGDTLAALLSQIGRHGSVAACGLAGGHELHTTVFPFILRGVNLLGIDSNTCPMSRRTEAWARIAAEVPKDAFVRMTNRVISLADVPDACEELLAGRVLGRIVVDVRA